MTTSQSMNKGKNSDNRYVSVGARIPFELRRMFKAQIALDGMDANTAIERLLSGYTEGRFNISDGEQIDLLEFIDQRKAHTQGTQTHNPTDIQTQNSAISHNLQTSKSIETVKSKPVNTSKQAARSGVIKHTTATELGQIRAKLGLSQRKLAQALDLHHSTVGDYERGDKETPKDVLERARQLHENS